MSMKAARGSKRACPSCGEKFYDLHRDPIICPVCQSVYHTEDTSARSINSGNSLDADDDAVLDAGRSGIEFVPLDEAALGETDDLPDIEGGDLGDAGDDDATLNTGEEEAFLEDEDEGETDVSGFVGGNGGGDDEHER